MSGSPYASALGRLKAHIPEFLDPDVYHRLTAAKDLGEVAKILETTPYGPEVVRAASILRGAPLLEVAINRTFVERNRRAFDSATFAGRAMIGTYLQRWDIENLGAILAAKVQGRAMADTEHGLVSWRELPAGIPAGTLTLDDLRALVAQPTLESAVNYLVRFGYGAVLLPLAETYARTHDIFPLVQALERDYYARVLEALKFFQGDEWVVREFLKAEIDERNVLLLLKAKDAGLPVEEVTDRWVDGGAVLKGSVADLYTARSIAELVGTLSARFPILPEGLEAYQANASLVGFESALQRARAIEEVRRMRAYPLSLAILMTYLMLAEVERADLRRIVYGKLYGFGPEKIEPLLVSPKL